MNDYGKYKIELTSHEMLLLGFLLNETTLEEDTANRWANVLECDAEYVENKFRSAVKKIIKAKLHQPSIKKRLATHKATEVRSDKAREKINNAINLLRLQGKDITHYSISQASGVSFNTVRKHIPNLDIIGKL